MHQILAQYNLMGRSPPLFRRPINLYARMQTEREKKKTERKKKNKRKKKRKKFRGTRKRETAHLGSLRAATKQSKAKESVCVCEDEGARWGEMGLSSADGDLLIRDRAERRIPGPPIGPASHSRTRRPDFSFVPQIFVVCCFRCLSMSCASIFDLPVGFVLHFPLFYRRLFVGHNENVFVNQWMWILIVYWVFDSIFLIVFMNK